MYQLFKNCVLFMYIFLSKGLFIWAEVIPVNVISVHGKTFVSYELSVTFHIIFMTRRDLACELVEKFSR
jgi:hypothetical protein